MKRFLLLTAMVLLGAAAGGAPVEVWRVIPNKIIYRPGEDGTITVRLANTTETAQTATLRVVTQWDLDQEREVSRQPVTLSPKEEKEIVLNWNTGPERYGRAVQAEVLQDDKVQARRAEFFNVIAEWWRVTITGGGAGGDAPEWKKLLDYYHLPYVKNEHQWYAQGQTKLAPGVGPFMGYGNHGMLYGRMPSVFGGMEAPDLPDNVTWYGGAGCYPMRNDELKAEAAWTKQWGYKLSAYSQSSLCGTTGIEIARRRPELVARTETGAFENWGYADLSPLELTKPITKGTAERWYGLGPDLYSTDAIRFGADSLKRLLRQFGYDSIFFDGCGYVVWPHYSWQGQAMPNGQDQEQVSARNIKLLRDLVREEFPDTFFWYNGTNPEHVGPFYPGGNGGGRGGKLEMMGDARSGGLRELQVSQITDPRNAAHGWRSLFEVYLSERDSMRKRDWGRPVSDIVHTGFLHPGSMEGQIGKEAYAKTRDQWAWANHAMSLMAAAQLHFCGGGWGFRPILQLMTRYSAFFWHEDLKIVDRTYRKFAVDSLREIWWEDVVYERDTPKYHDTIFNLINCPDAEKAHMQITQDPEAADDVEITLLKRGSANGLRAWAVTPYGYDAAVKEPTPVELKPSLVEGEVVYEVPRFTYFCLVVIRETKMKR